MTATDDGVRYLLARNRRVIMTSSGRVRFTGDYWQPGPGGWWMWGPVETAYFHTMAERDRAEIDAANAGAAVGGDWVTVLVNVAPDGTVG